MPQRKRARMAFTCFRVGSNNGAERKLVSARYIALNKFVGSDLSPIAAECRPISACSTQNKAKRANKIVFLLLMRDQEVEGLNPFALTTFFRISNLPRALRRFARLQH